MSSRKDQLETLADVIVPEAVEWVEQLKEYRKYKGRDQEYFRRARLGVNVISNAVRLCATIENSRSNDLVQKRLSMQEPPADSSARRLLKS